MGHCQLPPLPVVGFAILLVVAGAAQPAFAQGGGRLTAAEYERWRVEHAARLDAAASDRATDAARGAPTTGATPDASAAGFAAVADEALRVRPPETSLFAHADYLLAVEQLRLAVAFAATAASAAEIVAATERIEAARLNLRTVAIGGAPLAGPAPAAPRFELPAAADPGLAAATRDGVELAALAIQRPYLQSDAPALDAAHERVVVRFRLRNGSASSLPYYPLADLTLLLADGSTSRAVALGQAERFEAGELSPGDTLVSNAAFVVPRAATLQALRLAFADGFDLEVPLP